MGIRQKTNDDGTVNNNRKSNSTSNEKISDRIEHDYYHLPNNSIIISGSLVSYPLHVLFKKHLIFIPACKDMS